MKRFEYIAFKVKWHTGISLKHGAVYVEELTVVAVLVGRRCFELDKLCVFSPLGSCGMLSSRYLCSSRMV